MINQQTIVIPQPAAKGATGSFAQVATDPLALDSDVLPVSSDEAEMSVLSDEDPGTDSSRLQITPAVSLPGPEAQDESGAFDAGSDPQLDGLTLEALVLDLPVLSEPAPVYSTGDDSFDLAAGSSIASTTAFLPGYPEPVMIETQESGIGATPRLISVGTTATELNAIIAGAEPGAILVLANGTHVFDAGIVIDRGDITLKGESESGTVLEFDFPAGEETHAIEISGGGKHQVCFTQQDAVAGSNQLVLDQDHGVTVGTTLYVTRPNTQDYLAENGWDNVSWEDADQRPFREFIVEVIAVDGNTITLASDLPYDFDATVTKVYEIDLLADIELSDFTVTHAIDQVNNDYDFANVLPEFVNTASLMVRGTFEADFHNITVLDSPSNGFDIRSSLNFSGDNLHVDGAYNMGGGGNGYGIQLYETFDSTITDSEVYNTRHAVLFSSWHAETGNTIELNATNRDINFHGSPDTGNSVTVANAIMDYDPAQNSGTERGYWDIVSEGGRTHANTDFYAANTVTFGHAEGSDGYETIYGWDDGSWLDGNGGWDTLFGGAGSDVIIGGTGKDNLYGGEGDDVFVFQLGDSYDTVHDFSGISGDRIAITNTPAIDAFDDLKIWQNGDDAYVRYGGNSTIILSDYDASDLTADQFDFDWTDPSQLLV